MEDSSEEFDEEKPHTDDKGAFSIPSIGLFKWWSSTRVDTGDATGPQYGVWGGSTDDVFIVGTSDGDPVGNNLFQVRGGIFRYNGFKWREMSSPDDEFLEGVMLTAVWGSSSKDVYAVGSKWTVLHYDGIEWRRMETGLYSDSAASGSDGFWSVWGSSADNIYAVGGLALRR